MILVSGQVRNLDPQAPNRRTGSTIKGECLGEELALPCRVLRGETDSGNIPRERRNGTFLAVWYGTDEA